MRCDVLARACARADRVGARCAVAATRAHNERADTSDDHAVPPDFPDWQLFNHGTPPQDSKWWFGGGSCNVWIPSMTWVTNLRTRGFPSPGLATPVTDA
jgi:hypothetical protein